MNSLVLRAFASEIEKQSALADVGRRLLGSPVRGAATGALLGAAHGAATSDDKLQGAVGGALRGGALGGAAGFVGRKALDYRLLNPEAGAWQTAKGALSGVGRSAKHFGKRQIHGLTGAFKNDPAGMGMDTLASAQENIHLSRLKRDAALKRLDSKDFRGSAAEYRRYKDTVLGHLQRGAQGDLERAQGITSIPGTIKGLYTSPKETAKALWHRTTGSSRGGIALGVGLPVAFAAPGLLRGDESAEGGPTVRRKLMMLGGNVAGGIATAGLPVVPQMLAMQGIDSVLAHRQRTPAGPVVQDAHSLEARPALPSQRGRDDVR